MTRLAPDPSLSCDPSGHRYTHGHHESVLRSHRWRTAENSAAYLLSSIRPGLDILDVGCGPGTITLGLARRVGSGRVVGVDSAEEVIDVARANVRFAVGDTYALDFDDASFDIVHAHQMLQHLSDPSRALAELGRVCRPGGLVAARDGDYGGFTWFPADPWLDAWRDLYGRVARHNGGQPDGGRYLVSWARTAGFTDVVASGPGPSNSASPRPTSSRRWRPPGGAGPRTPTVGSPCSTARSCAGWAPKAAGRLGRAARWAG